MNIDKRLMACAELVGGKGKVCDIGTDHAYLVAYLIKEKICESAIAADINDGPLLAAAQTLQKYGVSEKITLIKSDGLENIEPEGISDIVIAGMGAELISEILSKCEWIKNDINLILQPMTHIPYLRKWLCENEFEIVRERIIKQDRFAYSVINAKYRGKTDELSPFEYEVGKISEINDDVKIYLLKQRERLLKVKKGCECLAKRDIEDKNATLKLDTINEIINQIDELMGG